MTVLTGQYFSLTGMVKDASGTYINNQNPTFSSSNTAKVTVRQLPSGEWQAKAVAAGSATITATLGAVTSTLAVTVVDSLTPSSIEISVGTVENSPN